MVVRLTTILWLFLLTLLFSINANAANELEVTVDRNKIHEQDNLNVQIVATTSKSAGFGGLFSFGSTSVGTPDLAPIEKDFEILDQSQSYNMQSINGQARTVITWELVLAPKRTGTLSIPALTYDNATSKPLTITVLAGKAPRDKSKAPLVFLEVEVDKKSAYVQEQILYTLRLFSAAHLDSGDLTAPTHPDLIVENFGDTRKFYRMVGNQRYEVRERQYLLFAQKSGALTIAPQNFTGSLIDTRSRRRIRANEDSDPVQLEIKAPPTSFTGSHWLPATSLILSETWDKEPFDILVGDSHTRTLNIEALGLLGSALPPLPNEEVSGIKLYPEQPAVESFQHDGGAKGVRKETSAWVAVAPGVIQIPEVRLPWWDTVNDVERVEVIPARTINIAENPDAVPVQPALPTPVENPAANAASGSATSNASDTSASPTFWYGLTSLLMLGWISTTLYLLRRVPRAPVTQVETTAMTPSYQTLLSAIEQDQAAMPMHLLRWAQSLHPSTEQQRNLRSIEDLQAWDQTLYSQAKAFEAQRYSPAPNPASAYDRKQLLARVRELAKTKSAGKQDNSLQTFYPAQPEK